MVEVKLPEPRRFRAMDSVGLVEGDVECSVAVVDVEVVAAVGVSGDMEIYGRVTYRESFEGTYNERVRDAARKKIGNATHLTHDLAANVSVIDPDAGILGGLKLWDTVR